MRRAGQLLGNWVSSPQARNLAKVYIINRNLAKNKVTNMKKKNQIQEPGEKKSGSPTDMNVFPSGSGNLTMRKGGFC